MPDRSSVTQIPYRSLVASFQRSLLAENLSPQTIRTYLTGVDQLQAFLIERGDANRRRGDFVGTC
jgi:hypothetical protein